MKIAALIFGILWLVTAIRFLCYRNQMRKIKDQLKFFTDQQTNIILQDDSSFPEIRELEESVNKTLDKCREDRRKTERGERTIKYMVTGLAHDIRTPLTSLYGYFDLLNETEDEKERSRYAQIIEERMNCLNDMLEELFLFAKLENEEYAIELEKVSVSHVLCDAVLGFYEEFKRKGITPEIFINPGPFYMKGNEAALKRIFQNVIKNVLIHGKGDITIRLKQEDDEVKIRISNTCEDVETIEVERLFDRFYKSKAARSKGSTGLGLAIAKELTGKMGGSIEAAVCDEDKFVVAIAFHLSKCA